MCAERPCEQAAGDGWRVEFAIHFNNEVADGELGQFAAFVEEQNIVAVGEIFFRIFVDGAMRGFVKEKYIV